MPGSEYNGAVGITGSVLPIDYHKKGTTMSGPKPELNFYTAEDFGFSTVGVDDIASEPMVALKLDTASRDSTKAQNKMESMYNAIMPLLNNLMKDADKNPYIHWPNRVEKIEAFIKKLDIIREE